MDPILDFAAEIAVWGSAALVVWGGMLTLQQLFDREFERERPQEPAGRGEPAAPGGHTRLAN